MVLYAADLIDFEKPKPITEKTDKLPAEPKVKKEMTEKQKAALLKAQETRKLKKEAAAKEKLEQEELARKLQEAALKKPRKKAKVEEPEVKVEEVNVEEKPKKQKKVKVAEPAPEPTPEPAPEPKKRKRESKPKSNDPPEWFKKYVEGVQKEKAAAGGDVSKKQETIIKNEALKVAQKSWDSGFTRDRVQNEVDSHMNRMYSMIFSR